jgi:hypothetical protein
MTFYEAIKVDHPDILCRLENVPHEIASDETAAAGDENFHLGFAFLRLIIIILQLESQCSLGWMILNLD